MNEDSKNLRTLVIRDEVKATAFSFYTAEEIKKISVKRILTTASLDVLGNPIPGGLYDPAMGPINRFETCATCGLGERDCPGHIGHIELAVPVYNPMMFKQLVRILRAKCFECHQLRLSRDKVNRLAKSLSLLDEGKIVEALDVDNYYLHRDWCAEQLKETASTDGPKPSRKVLANLTALRKYAQETLEKIKTEEEAYDNAHQGIHNQSVDELFKAKSSRTQEFRRALVELLHAVPKVCENCKSKSPNIRGDRKEKIFKTTLASTAKAVNKMVASSNAAKTAAAQKKKGKEEAEKADKSKKKAKKTDEEAGSDDDDDKSDSDDSDDDSDEGSDDDEEKSASEEEQAEEVVKKAKKPAAKSSSKVKYMAPSEVLDHIKKLYAAEEKIMRLAFGSIRLSHNLPAHRAADPMVYFLETVAVPPSRFRPLNMVNGMAMDHPQNIYLARIMTYNDQLLTAKTDKGEMTVEQRVELWISMQKTVNALFDSSNAGVGAAAGIKQLLEKKEGLFRKHMMGKRVNFAARSVISPDPFLQTNEIGIPLVFAMKLTFPEPVTETNFREMQQAVMNGPGKYPGANAVIDENGHTTVLRESDEAGRLALSKTLRNNEKGLVKVLRHLRDGDAVLVNRQPSLHKPSIMAHIVRVLRTEKTIRMHYANCDAYNADFDGDEMNIHFPQSDLARAEAYTIALGDEQYIVPTDGSPLRGLIQDHVVMGSLLTNKDTMLTREEFQQLLYAAISTLPPTRGSAHLRYQTPIITIPPCIVKPVPLWSGKQVISNLLMELLKGYQPLNLDSSSKIPAASWKDHSEEGIVIVRGNELLTGILDKSQFGASAYGLVHATYELYGSKKAGELLSALGRLFTFYLNTVAFTCGIDDMLINNEFDSVRQGLLRKANNSGYEVASEFLGYSSTDKVDRPEVRQGLGQAVRDPDEATTWDNLMKKQMSSMTTDIIKETMKGQVKKFPWNNLTLMTTSGAKGSMVNVSQICCLLGQQELEGKRVSSMISGKTLPSFEPHEAEGRAGGYIADRFLTGIRPQEFFFHCMAGREGLIDTAVKTSRSGYLQRCLVKHLESLRVCYDATVRDSDASVIQFNYGEDSIDITKSKHLERFSFLSKNTPALVQKYYLTAARQALQTKPTKRYLKKRAKNAKLNEESTLQSEFETFLHLGAVSERYQEKLEKYIAANPDGTLESKKKDKKKPKSRNTSVQYSETTFRDLMYLYYHRCQADPGESVGLLAAQSIGEPSTQMTLNTFHLAGRGEANVTLGIPRLREIIMTASHKIKTPTMTLPLHAHAGQKEAQKLADELYRLTLNELVAELTVTETITSSGSRSRLYNVALQFKPLKDWPVDTAKLSFQRVCNALEDSFIPKLLGAIRKELKMKKTKIIQRVRLSDGDINQAMSGENDDAEDPTTQRKSTRNEEDESAALGKERSRKQEHASYDDAEEEELREVADAGRKQKHSVDSSLSEMKTRLKGKQDDDEQTTGKSAGPQKVAPVKATTRASPSKPRKVLLGSDEILKDYRFDHKRMLVEVEVKVGMADKKLLMISLVEALVANFVVKQVDGIKRAFVIPPPNGQTKYAVQTEGVNFGIIAQFADVVDLSGVRSNDIYAVLTTFGVEAARRSIADEINGVFKVYGIGVDHRHLAIIADYMTFEGGYKPFNRAGMNMSTSPYQKMSFETTTVFLADATMRGDWDPISNASASLVLGKVVEGGTGCFELLQPLILPTQPATSTGDDADAMSE